MSTPTKSSSRDSGRRKLGQILLERNEITGEQLIRAIQSQRRLGGRIGTCMLEMEVVTEDDLLAALSDQLGVPAIRIEQLRGIDDEILGLIPAETASRCQAVPIAADPREVEVATLNVGDLALLDELAFCAGRRIRPRIANEARIFEALEKYYGQEIPRRYGHLLDRLNRQRYLWAKEGDSAKLPPLEVVEDDPLPSFAVADDERPFFAIPDDEQPFFAVPDDAQQPPPPTVAAQDGDRNGNGNGNGVEPPRTPGTDHESTARIRELMFKDAERMLDEETDRDSIGEVLLQILDLTFHRCALFKIRRGQVHGWEIRGEGVDGGLFGGLRLPVDQPSIFFNLDNGGSSYLGPLPPMPIHRELVRCLGGGSPKGCLLVPLRIRGRMVAAFYGDRGLESLEDVDVPRFEALARKAEQALENCIVQRKIASAQASGTVVQPAGLQ